ncbi:Translation initiation factor IF-2, mitochondrial [Trichoplax sp. H2]|nr:Translation initiation factor IF-2, mitochondrial [Trichoplax sp. H2]|eukprot:RDD42981.1 Translation initiation factor IF-2, mitochondrial [Trichoplax sp. H2]
MMIRSNILNLVTPKIAQFGLWRPPLLLRLFSSSQVNYFAKKKSKEAKKLSSTQILLRSNMSLLQFANEIKVEPEILCRKLQELDDTNQYKMDTILSRDLQDLLLLEYNIAADEISHGTSPSSVLEDKAALVTRPPVVTIMGHIDHGKTTLLDQLRHTSVAAGEAGGITQHIGAFLVNVAEGKQITFLDTPGHAAFTSMRARGANVTDVVVLVIAADDGIKPQTTESIKYAKLAGVPIIVAINKIDKKGTNISKVKLECLRNGLQLEEYGGEIQAIEVSALKGTNLDNLIEAILIHGEIANLRADPTSTVKGVVIESKVDKGLGFVFVSDIYMFSDKYENIRSCLSSGRNVSTVLVERGTLRKGQFLVSGSTFAKVRLLLNHAGKQIKEALPSHPIQVVGWRNLPEVGDDVIQTNSEAESRELIDIRNLILKRRREEANSVVALKRKQSEGVLKNKNKGDPILDTAEEQNELPKLAIVLKGDVTGSVEAVIEAIQTFKSNAIEIKILESGVGPIVESDIELADSFQGMCIILGFNVKPTKESRQLAKKLDTYIYSSNIIYNLLEIVKKEVLARLPLISKEEFVGEANVLQIFDIGVSNRKTVQVAGCRILEGALQRNAVFRVSRNSEVVYEGPANSLKHLKNDVDIVKKGQECGISFGNTCTVEENDKITCFTIKKTEQTVDWDF